MLCRYFAFQLLIGAAVVLALAELVYPVSDVTRDKPRDIPATHPDSESYLVAQDISVDIPEFLLRPDLIPIKEPDDTPLLADAYLRAGGGG